MKFITKIEKLQKKLENLRSISKAFVTRHLETQNKTVKGSSDF